MVSGRPDLDAIEQMCSAPSDGYSAGAWCEAANALLAYVRELEAERDGLREAARRLETTCREWKGNNRCGAPAEFVLWGKLLAVEALGPRCYDCAAGHVGHRALGDPSYAIVDLRPIRTTLAASVPSEPARG